MNGSALHLIDVGVDGLQSGGVAGAEVSAAGHTRYVGQQCFVDLDRLILVAQPTGRISSNRHRCPSNAADSNPVNLDAVRFGSLGRRERLDRSTVVDTVGEENDHLRLAWRVTKTVGCRRDRVADRRSILQLPRLKIR